MFNRIGRRRAEREFAEIRRQHAEFLARVADEPLNPAQPADPLAPPAEPGAVVDDFLPPELRVPSHDQVDGRAMPWAWPVVLDGEMVACAVCGAYRDWLVLSTRDQIWLRCRASHQQHETRLDTAWYNRHAGPADAMHATFEECLRHLGH
ncbi:hypothetical protein [Streptomyces sp. NPDC058653]|uniref:hypothetical protein n=1 Tax=Streptomyces sp. NPDC058653 TaxID=3346576 RepID=UPI00365DC8CA